jgi:hypothetical protein
MRRLLFAALALGLLSSTASAQSSMPRSIISGGQFCSYGNSGAQVCIPYAGLRAPARINCLRANYASTIAAESCLTARTALRGRSRR